MDKLTVGQKVKVINPLVCPELGVGGVFPIMATCEDQGEVEDLSALAFLTGETDFLVEIQGYLYYGYIGDGDFVLVEDDE